MAQAGRIQWLSLAWLCGIALSACLPATLSDTALKQKIAAAQAAHTPCGNAKLEADQGEICDDGNPAACDGCEGCQLRRALDVKGKNAIAVVSDTAKLGIAATTNFSVETWFLTRKLPTPGGTLVFAGVGKPGAAADASGYFGMGLYRPDNKSATYPVCALARTSTLIAQGVDPVAQDTWHHLRCTYLAGSNQLLASVDGKVAQKGVGLLKSPGKLFEAGAWLMVGAVPNEKAPTELFSGLLDEFRVVAGDGVTGQTAVAYRYEGDESGTVLLYHMDLLETDRVLADASAHQIDAEQINLDAIPTKQAEALPSAIDACYGVTEEQRSCEPLPNPAPAWCPAS